MDLDSALRLFDALESDTEIEDNVVSVEPVISVPLNEVHDKLDQNQNFQFFDDIAINEEFPPDIVADSENATGQYLEVIVNIINESNQPKATEGNTVFEDTLSDDESTDNTTTYETEEDTANSNDQDTETSTIETEQIGRKSRKRKRNYKDWNQTIRKRKRQAGEEYVSSRGKRFRQREVKHRKDCSGKCKYRCTNKITNSEREAFFKEFWGLCDTQKKALCQNYRKK